MRLIFVLLVFISTFAFAQAQPKSVQKDPYFTPNTLPKKNAPPPEKVKHLHSDELRKDEKYEGNNYFTGSVQFSHQGSLLNADLVIFYEEQNFIKAIGNVKLQNADGSVITADEMEYDGNTQKGIARKNVVLTDPKGTIIKTETMYYDRVANQAYYNTGGTINDGKSTTYSKSATYFLTTRTIDLTGRVKIEDSQYVLEGENVVQNQNTNIVDINGPTTITNKKNYKNRIVTDKGNYNTNTKEAFLYKNSKVFYNDKILTGDEMYYNQLTGFGKATGHVTLDDPNERRWIKGGYGEIFEKKDSAMMTKNPYAVKALEKDSMYFAAEKILSFQRPDPNDSKVKKSFLRAFKKGRFYKSNASGRADSIAFNETDGVLHMFTEPILWSNGKQITGDKVEAYFDTQKENIDSLKVIGNAFAISKVDSLDMKDEFNQVKGKLMTIYYGEDNNIKEAKVIGNAQSITYSDDVNEKTKEKERIGISLTSCGIIDAIFEEKVLYVVACNIGANSDTYPMSKIEPAKRKFPDFNWNTKDRILKWQDILVDTPNHDEIKYESDDVLYNKAQEVIDKEKAKEEAKKPKRTRR
ncbi:lipopolysaccharide export system protein LptA [Chryseobacterium ginsenosidimutans]|uniref:OstA-like protein n=1 Tax=Chryseobacterium ginsenosidimutans TaxID=687846 RepID=UPI00216A6CC5|nr:OstA-like protein [Chryseobacterium ginsenosidimutans]MCS3871183.1 lipopolysaccharide export system protein LptA [Chryseobacterium ginsenosidimutans]